MNFLYIWWWIFYCCCSCYYCSHSFSAHFLSGSRVSTLPFSSFGSHLQHQKKKQAVLMLIVVVAIRTVTPGLMSVSQFVCNNVATSQYLNHLKPSRSWLDLPHLQSDSFCFFFGCSQRPMRYVWFNECSTVCFSSLPPRHRLPSSPPLLSLCVSCCLSV